MIGNSPSRANVPPEPESYLRLLANLGGLLLTIAALFVVVIRSGETPQAVPAKPPDREPDVGARPAPSPVAVAIPKPVPRARPLDRAAIAGAEAALDAASRDRARAEARAEEAARQLADASNQAAAEAAAGRTLALRVRDPSARLARAEARGKFLRADRDRLKGEVMTLSHAPPTQSQVADRQDAGREAGRRR